MDALLGSPRRPQSLRRVDDRLRDSTDVEVPLVEVVEQVVEVVLRVAPPTGPLPAGGREDERHVQIRVDAGQLVRQLAIGVSRGGARAQVASRDRRPPVVGRAAPIQRTGGTVTHRSGKVLSESLADLEEKGLIERPVSVEYHLTESGAGLGPVTEETVDWGEQYLRGADSPEESVI